MAVTIVTVTVSERKDGIVIKILYRDSAQIVRNSSERVTYIFLFSSILYCHGSALVNKLLT